MHRQFLSLETQAPCDIFFHIPKTGGQTFHNIVSREYRHEWMLNTHCGLLTRPMWQQFVDAVPRAGDMPRYRAVIGHMRFGAHKMLPWPSRYLAFLRDPVKRFLSYYYMLRHQGILPPDHEIDPGRPDWNLARHETLPREIDNGQTRALANADWDLPLGQCSEKHYRQALDNLNRHFDFIGVTEDFDLSLMVLRKLYGWRWHLYARKNITPPLQGAPVSAATREAISELNRYDRQLHAHARERLAEMARRYGLGLRMELAAYRACNAIHQSIHHFRYPLKQKWKQALSEAREDAENPRRAHNVLHQGVLLDKP